MRHWFSPTVWCLALVLAGCARDKSSTPQYQDLTGTGPAPEVAPVTSAAPTPPAAPVAPAAAPAAPPAPPAPPAPTGEAPAAPAADQKMIVTEAVESIGKVSRVNAELRFVVLSFPIGRMPALNHSLGLYRNGLKVGEVNLVGPQNNESIVADLTSGEAEVGDEAREK